MVLLMRLIANTTLQMNIQNRRAFTSQDSASFGGHFRRRYGSIMGEGGGGENKCIIIAVT